MTLNTEQLDNVLRDADELLTRFVPAEVGPTWNRMLEILGIYGVISQLWQDPKGKLSQNVEAIKPVVLAAFEMGREAERDGTA